MANGGDDDMRNSAPMPERPLTVVAAIVWFLCATFGTLLLLVATRVLRPSSGTDLVNAVACQAAAYSITVFLAVRYHADNSPLLSTLAFRKTDPWMYLLGLLLGVCMHVPADLLQRLVFHFKPRSPEAVQLQIDILRMESPVSRFMIPIAVVILGPAVEELLFRGVLYGGMRRCTSLPVSLFVASALFAGAHQDGLLFLPFLIVGGVITLLRAASGSLWPCLIAHAVFNAVPIVALASGWIQLTPEPDPMPLALSIGGVLASALLVAVLLLLFRNSDAAARARSQDSV